jgi:hypothetical protein
MSHEKDDKHGFDTQDAHESYGMIGISRVQGHHRLFGSPIEPQHAIWLRISEGSVRHGLGREWYHDGDLIAEVAMSEVQFAQMITTPNMGSGIPCTLLYHRDGKGLKKCETPPKQQSEASKTRDEYTQEVASKIGTLKSVRRQVEKLIDESGISGKRKEEIKSAIIGLTRLFEDSAPFLMKSFEENIEKVIAVAKVEISTHAEHVLRETGVQALKSGDVPLLESK